MNRQGAKVAKNEGESVRRFGREAYNKIDSCPLCEGRKNPGTTTFTGEPGFGVVVVRNVPATVCSQCGADWIADDVAGRIEALVDDARRKRLQVEARSMT